MYSSSSPKFTWASLWSMFFLSVYHSIKVPLYLQFNSVQSLSRVWLFVTPWITAHQASLSITNSRRLLRLMSIESVMPSSHLILCRSLLLLPPIPPSIRVFSNESTLAWGSQTIGVSASASVSPMNTYGWSPYTSLMSWCFLQPKTLETGSGDSNSGWWKECFRQKKQYM